MKRSNSYLARIARNSAPGGQKLTPAHGMLLRHQMMEAAPASSSVSPGPRLRAGSADSAAPISSSERSGNDSRLSDVQLKVPSAEGLPISPAPQPLGTPNRIATLLTSRMPITKPGNDRKTVDIDSPDAPVPIPSAQLASYTVEKPPFPDAGSESSANRMGAVYTQPHELVIEGVRTPVAPSALASHRFQSEGIDNLEPKARTKQALPSPNLTPNPPQREALSAPVLARLAPVPPALQRRAVLQNESRRNAPRLEIGRIEVNVTPLPVQAPPPIQKRSEARPGRGELKARVPLSRGYHHMFGVSQS